MSFRYPLQKMYSLIVSLMKIVIWLTSLDQLIILIFLLQWTDDQGILQSLNEDKFTVVYAPTICLKLVLVSRSKAVQNGKYKSKWQEWRKIWVVNWLWVRGVEGCFSWAFAFSMSKANTQLCRIINKYKNKTPFYYVWAVANAGHSTWVLLILAWNVVVADGGVCRLPTSQDSNRDNGVHIL